MRNHLCQISWEFYVPTVIKIGSLMTDLFKKNNWVSSGWRFLWNSVYISMFLIFSESTFFNVRHRTFSKIYRMMWL